MTQLTEVIEGNKLIAVFDDLVLFNDDPDYGEVFYHKGDNYKINHYPISELHYHDSWDWLMPVVEKIEKDISASFYFGFTVVISDVYCYIKCHEKDRQDGIIYQTPYGTKPESKIKAVWDAVINFIQWYNNQNEQS